MKQLAYEVHIQLDTFLLLQNQYLPKPGFLNKLRHVFNKMDYHQYSQQLGSIEKSLDLSLDRIKAYAASEKEAACQQTLQEYTEALTNAVYLLKCAVSGLAEKADGKEFSWSKYSYHMKEFENAEKQYVEIGNRLNREILLLDMG